ncbi:MAG TPA: Uma2 family endonuclease [Pseudonocardia sp.]|nr:Uma2 family endonuclease [Pseudonocardia sp.]
MPQALHHGRHVRSSINSASVESGFGALARFDLPTCQTWLVTEVPIELPEPRPPRLLTVAEYAALGETEFGYTELLEGRLLLSPSPTPDHIYAMGEMFVAIRAALPRGLEALQDADLDLRLAPERSPGTVRRPDLMVVTADARRRVRAEGGLLQASDVSVVVEIVSPGSVRTDRLTKRGEYADAGIPHYWIVDITEPVSILACYLAGEFGYVDSGEITDTFSTREPFPLELNPDRLL